MRFPLALLLAAAVLCTTAGPASAVVVELTDGTRVAGFLVREDEKTVVLRRRLPGGEEKREEIPRERIAEVHRAVRAERLEKLSKDRPEGYRDYAEELVERRDDPEARQTALRLFLIAAYLAPERLGGGCLLSMSHLAATPAEAQRFRGMALLLDPRLGPDALTRRDTGKAPEGKEAPGRDDFLAALAAFRARQTAKALAYARKPGVAEWFAASELLRFAEFVKACEDHPECGRCQEGRVTVAGKSVPCPHCKGKPRPAPLSERDLRRVILAELAALGQAATAEAGRATPGRSWGALLDRGRTAPAPFLSLETLTEFDPRQCLYRGGKWVLPSDAGR
jgi:hypothetical protein